MFYGLKAFSFLSPFPCKLSRQKIPNQKYFGSKLERALLRSHLMSLAIYAAIDKTKPQPNKKTREAQT
jgi:hypothetical protein